MNFKVDYPVTSKDNNLESGEDYVSILKETRDNIFTRQNPHFNYKETFSLKFIKENKGTHNIFNLDLKYIRTQFIKWRDRPTYLICKVPKTKKHSKGIKGHLASKRGNSVYSHFLNLNLDNQLAFMDNEGFDKQILRDKKGFRDEKLTNCMFITLTCDLKKYGNHKLNAWINFQHDYNIFITRLRKKYGKSWVMKSVESTKQGNPHIHLLIISNHTFNALKLDRHKCNKDDDNNGCGKWFTDKSKKYKIQCPHCKIMVKNPYRIKERDEIKKFWKHILDIRVPDPTQSKQTTLNFMKSYIFKDMLKQYDNKNKKKEEQSLNSLALGWLFGLRCYSVSVNDEHIRALIKTSCPSQTQKEEISNEGYEFLGILNLSAIDRAKPPPNIFYISEDAPEYEDFLNAIIKPRKKENPIIKNKGILTEY